MRCASSGIGLAFLSGEYLGEVELAFQPFVPGRLQGEILAEDGLAHPLHIVEGSGIVVVVALVVLIVALAAAGMRSDQGVGLQEEPQVARKDFPHLHPEIGDVDGFQRAKG